MIKLIETSKQDIDSALDNWRKYRDDGIKVEKLIVVQAQQKWNEYNILQKGWYLLWSFLTIRKYNKLESLYSEVRMTLTGGDYRAWVDKVSYECGLCPEISSTCRIQQDVEENQLEYFHLTEKQYEFVEKYKREANEYCD